MSFRIDKSYPVYHLEIEEGAQYLTEDDIGKEFVRAKPFKTSYGLNWSYMLFKPSEKQLRQQAVKLTAELWNSKKTSEEWNDGQWILVDKCITLFNNHSSSVQKVSHEEFDLDI